MSIFFLKNDKDKKEVIFFSASQSKDQINMNLCLFNLLPIGPLDGSSVWPHFLPHAPRRKFMEFNDRYGTQVLMGLVMVSLVLPGFSPFRWIGEASRSLISWMVWNLFFRYGVRSSHGYVLVICGSLSMNKQVHDDGIEKFYGRKR